MLLVVNKLECDMFQQGKSSIKRKDFARISFVVFSIFSLVACNNPGGSNTGTDSSSVSITSAISSERTNVKAEPVASYHYAIPNDLNSWEFNVSLKETSQRFNYVLEMQYQEMTGMDTITIPNFGFEPEPAIKKGSNDLECIIGFLDKEKKFRDYLKVFVDNDRLRVKTLKQYAVYQK
jgi:hypothetical protein